MLGFTLIAECGVLMRPIFVLLMACVTLSLGCGGGGDITTGSDQVSSAQKLMELTGKLDGSGTTGCLAECMKFSTQAMKAAEAGQLTKSMELNQKGMACQSRCEKGGGRAAAAAKGVGNNTTGCLAKCMEYSTKAMKLAEKGDLSGSMDMNQKAMACQSRCK